MGLFGNKNKKLAEEFWREASKTAERKVVICPKCRTRATVTFLGSGDSYTCKKCGYRIYASEL